MPGHCPHGYEYGDGVYQHTDIASDGCTSPGECRRELLSRLRADYLNALWTARPEDRGAEIATMQAELSLRG